MLKVYFVQNSYFIVILPMILSTCCPVTVEDENYFILQVRSPSNLCVYHLNLLMTRPFVN